MEGEDSEQLVIPDNRSPSDQNRKLKRLKKAFVAPKSPVFDSLLQDEESKSPKSSSKSLDSTNSGDELLGSEHRSEKDLFDSLLQDDESKSPESSSKSLDSADVLLRSEHRSAVFESEKESEEFDLLFPWEGERPGTKRALDFGPDDDDSSDELGVNRDSENQGSEGVVGDKKGNRKRAKSNVGDEEKKERRRKKNKKEDKSVGAGTKPKVSKRKEKEERKAEIDMLVDYQRQLRERRDVAFKPVSAVQKPVSSVLERIRQRKQQVSLKAAVSISNQFSDSFEEIMIESDSEEVVIVKKEDHKGEMLCKDQTDPSAVKDDRPSSSPVDGSDEDLTKLGDGQNSCEMPLAEDKEPSAAFRPPTNDTQELYSESQTSDTQDGNSNAETRSSQDDDVAPSLPSVNLKLDSAPFDDIDISLEDEEEEEEENDKENINPLIGQLFKANLSPKGDPVKEFLDEEALEEDCSDEDKRRFEDDGEDYSDAEEMAEMIATNYNEKPVDHERRNELHQMWLAQQDEVGTDNLLQRYKVKPKDVTLLDEEDEGQDTHEMDDESGDEDLPPTNGARLKTKQLRQLIPQMFTDKDDGYISSDDEETERSLNKQRLLGKVVIKEQAAFASVAENEMSREVFVRIKKLNLVAETKKKVKTSSIFQNLVKKGPDSNSSKSSFLNRMSSIPVSSRRTSNTVKAYIFGRDDSNSRTSISASEEDSRDAMNQAEKSIQRKRTFTAKFSSQAGQSTQTSAGTSHNTSLIDILKRSSVQTSHFAQDDNNTVDHQAAFDAFKPSKRPVKIEARS